MNISSANPFTHTMATHPANITTVNSTLELPNDRFPESYLVIIVVVSLTASICMIFLCLLYCMCWGNYIKRGNLRRNTLQSNKGVDIISTTKASQCYDQAGPMLNRRDHSDDYLLAHNIQANITAETEASPYSDADFVARCNANTQGDVIYQNYKIPTSDETAESGNECSARDHPAGDSLPTSPRQKREVDVEAGVDASEVGRTSTIRRTRPKGGHDRAYGDDPNPYCLAQQVKT
ncbi:hypothetical protein BgiBS90_029066 [Biomphalaria glabrata]|nr:hypothetical protein BgiBS90_029066 [Biomphalaria glabrata]